MLRLGEESSEVSCQIVDGAILGLLWLKVLLDDLHPPRLPFAYFLLPPTSDVEMMIIWGKVVMCSSR
jgi:hypothetical protein